MYHHIFLNIDFFLDFISIVHIITCLEKKTISWVLGCVWGCRRGKWNTGGSCGRDRPEYNENLVKGMTSPAFSEGVRKVVAKMKRPMEVLQITRMSELRPDAHLGNLSLRRKDCL